MKQHIKFRKIIQYCKLMEYDLDEILDMSDNELRLWYNRISDIAENEIAYTIRTGISLDDKKHKVVSIVDSRFDKR